MKFQRSNLKKALYFLGFFFLSLVISLIIYGFYLKNKYLGDFNPSSAQKPLQIYAFSEKIIQNQKINLEALKTRLKRNLGEENNPQDLKRGKFSFLRKKQCKKRLKNFFHEKTDSCLIIFHPEGMYEKVLAQMHFILLDEKNKVLKIFQAFPMKEVFETFLEIKSIVQIENKKMLLKKDFLFEEIPETCLMAITAAEDIWFLDHKGFSPSGMLRALYKNIFTDSLQGGSTITQQLIKNYFLNPERSLKRKFNELVLSILIESFLNKDQILHLYLSIIYMGQSNQLQVRGYEAASLFYFNEKLKNLQGDQCALLAALVKSPGSYNPFKYPEKAKKRRDYILNKMHENGMISFKEKNKWTRKKLPEKNKKSDPSISYIVQFLEKELEDLYSLKSADQVFTTIDLKAQKKASLSVRKSLKDDRQASLLSIHVPSGGIRALIGGTYFLENQFNRVFMSQRQVGSLIKPFIYLLAMEKNYSPLSIMEDKAFSYAYENQIYRPKNYKNKYYSKVPLYFSLKKSLNTVSLRLALDLGLKDLVDLLRTFKITSPMKAYPSLALGSFEMSLFEISQAYLILAKKGIYEKAHLVKKVLNEKGEIVFSRKKENKRVFSELSSSLVLSMMKQVSLKGGTAGNLLSYKINYPVSSKTGTTNETKDAWFVGMTPYLLTAVWVGYDDNRALNLTGAGAALPIWASYMKSSYFYPKDDFLWPKDTRMHLLHSSNLKSLFSDPYVFIEEIKGAPIKLILKE